MRRNIGEPRHYGLLITYRLQIGGAGRSLRPKTIRRLPKRPSLKWPDSNAGRQSTLYLRATIAAKHEGERSLLHGPIRSMVGLLAYRSTPPYNLQMPMEPLEIERLSAQEGPRVLCLRGPLTLENLPQFQNAIRREENVPMVIVDLSDVPYIDSSGLGSLVSAYVTRRKATRHIALSGVNERVLKLFETTKVEPLFLIFPTLDDAIAALTTAAEA